MELSLNPDVAPRMRGVVEKCDFCHGRLHEAEDVAAAAGQPAAKGYTPACAEACPTRAIVFGDTADPNSAVSRLIAEGDSFVWLEKLDTQPKVRYRTRKPWLKAMAERGGAAPQKEVRHG